LLTHVLAVFRLAVKAGAFLVVDVVHPSSRAEALLNSRRNGTHFREPLSSNHPLSPDSDLS
jgi:hypothetical protein